MAKITDIKKSKDETVLFLTGHRRIELESVISHEIPIIAQVIYIFNRSDQTHF